MQKTMLCTALAGYLLLAACAFDLAHVSFTPTVCTPKSDKSFTMREDTKITGMPCSYNRTVLKGTTWNLVGTVPEGEVYKSNNQVMSVECSNIHEAYLVVRETSVVGFYLPFEKGFVKLSEPITLRIE